MVLNLEAINKLIKEKGWSDSKLAKESGLSTATISRVMSGKRGAGTRTLEGMLKAFPNEPVEKLFFLPK